MTRSLKREYPNIVWLLVDSIRTYRGSEDVRGRLPVMDAFARESIEFTTCVTTAPSTIMSVTGMMTGLPAYFLARNYDHFRFDTGRFPSVAAILEEQAGYSSFGFLRGQETRLKLGPLVEPLPRRYWPAGATHGLKWSNADLNAALDRWLEADVSRPVFLFFHYNPQTRNERRELIVDEDVSDRVAYALQRLREAGFTSENTITILCSDHGFPDPSKGLTSEWEERHRLSHDLVLTDDNILIPLFIQYPGCRPCRIETPVSSLDLYPTLLQLTGQEPAADVEDRSGVSLVPLMEGARGREWDRTFRCDARLMFQKGRATAMRGARYKYIRFHDDYRLPVAQDVSPEGEVLVDLREDPDETRNLLQGTPLAPKAREALERLRFAMDESERRAVEYQIDFLLSKQGNRLEVGAEGTSRVLLLFEPETAGLRQVGVRAVTRKLQGASVDVLTAGGFDGEKLQDVSLTAAASGDRSPDAAQVSSPPPGYDLAVIFVQNPHASVGDALQREARRLQTRRRLVVDCNFNAYRWGGYWIQRLRSLRQRLPLLLEEPALAWSFLRTGARVVIRRVARRLGIWDRWSPGPAETPANSRAASDD